jgi:hypothetical protein
MNSPPGSSPRSSRVGASRDLFDARELLRAGTLDRAKLRLGFVIYGAANRVDWRTVSAESVSVTARDVGQRLLPMLRSDLVPPRRDVGAWTVSLVTECQNLLSAVLPLAESERSFMDAINDRGEIIPDLITSDPDLKAIIGSHPALMWKAANVRKHRELVGKNAPPS